MHQSVKTLDVLMANIVLKVCSLGPCGQHRKKIRNIESLPGI